MADNNLKSENDEELEEFEPQIVDLDGEPFEVIDAICYDGQNYVALIPCNEDDDEDGAELEFLILKEVEENGEYMLATVDDDALYDEVGEAFIEHLEMVFGEENEHDHDCHCEDCQ